MKGQAVRETMVTIICGVFVTLMCFAVTVAPAASHTAIYQAQNRLKALGYDPGSLDGAWGEKSAAALRKFQEDQGLPVTGSLDDATREKLGIDVARIKRANRDKTPASMPNNAAVYEEHGNDYQRKQQYHLAIEEYNKALKLSPDRISSYVARGVAYTRVDEFNLAIEDYNKALKLRPKDTLVYYLKAIAHDILGQTQEAIESYMNAARYSGYSGYGSLSGSLRNARLRMQELSGTTAQASLATDLSKVQLSGIARCHDRLLENTTLHLFGISDDDVMSKFDKYVEATVSKQGEKLVNQSDIKGFLKPAFSHDAIHTTKTGKSGEYTFPQVDSGLYFLTETNIMKHVSLFKPEYFFIPYNNLFKIEGSAIIASPFYSHDFCSPQSLQQTSTSEKPLVTPQISMVETSGEYIEDFQNLEFEKFSFEIPKAWHIMEGEILEKFKKEHEEVSRNIYQKYYNISYVKDVDISFMHGFISTHLNVGFVVLLINMKSGSEHLQRIQMRRLQMSNPSMEHTTVRDYLDEMYFRSIEVTKWGINQGIIKNMFSNQISKINEIPVLETDLEFRDGRRIIGYNFQAPRPMTIVQVVMFSDSASYEKYRATFRHILGHIKFTYW